MDNCSQVSVCPIVKWLDLFEKKWSIRIIRQLYAKPRGFNELKANVHGITQGVLSQRLGELESAGIVSRRVVNKKPLQVEYSLNEEAKCMLNCGIVRPVAESVSVIR